MKRRLRPGVLLALAGLILVIVAAGIVVGNERTVLAFRAASARHGGEVVDLGHDAVPDRGLYGHMVRVSGVPRIVQPPVDPVFAARADTTMLQRVVEMFQWHEIKVGGDISYQLDWIDHSVDWHHFDHPGGHANPRHFPFHGATFVAPEVRLDGFRLSAAMVRALPGFEACDPDLSRLPPNLEASFHTYHGALVSSADPGSPRLGDLRVSWQCIPLRVITVLARVRGKRLVAARHPDTGPGFYMQIGNRSVRDILPDVPSQPESPWVWRVTALLLAWAAAYMLSRGWRRPRLEPVATLAFALAVVSGFAGTLWVGTVWLLGIAMLAVAVAAAGLAAWLLHASAQGHHPDQT